MKKFILVVLLIVGGAYYYYPMWKQFVPQEFTSKVDEFASSVVKEPPLVEKKSNAPIVGSKTTSGAGVIERAFKNRTSKIQVSGSGQVLKILPDDRQGSKHQRFLLKLDSNQTLLVAHNIDLAPRINSLRIGDTVDFYGEYAWNSEGGVVHWTHHDPPGGSNHKDGWLKYKGRVYQ